MLRVSIVVPTRDRPADLAELLETIYCQSYPPFEVIIIDGSPLGSAKQVLDSYSLKFRSANCKLEYVRGGDDGLPAARNLGVKISRGDALLFLDDDTLLDQNVVSALANFLRDNPVALGVQPKILPLVKNKSDDRLGEKFTKAIYKVLLLAHNEENRLTVGRSGASIFPSDLTRVISAQRLSGCCCCYRREIFTKLRFDTSLKRWGFMEDLDFSFRVYKAHPKSLYAIPHARVIHKKSENSRLPTKLNVYMITVYWSYVFLKDVFDGSILGLMAFLWTLIGNLACALGGLTVRRKPRYRSWEIAYLINSYFYALKHLEEIKEGNLGFFNRRFKE